MAKTAKSATLPKVSVLERRLQNPFGAPSVAVTLKTPGEWEVRWVFSKLRSGHIYQMVHHKGWAFVEPHELDGDPAEYGLVAKDNRLVRGDHGEEVLMKMPRADFLKIRQAKADANLKQLGKKQMQESAAQTATTTLGGEAGDGVFNAFKHGDVIDSRETREEESA